MSDAQTVHTWRIDGPDRQGFTLVANVASADYDHMKNLVTFKDSTGATIGFVLLGPGVSAVIDERF